MTRPSRSRTSTTTWSRARTSKPRSWTARGRSSFPRPSRFLCICIVFVPMFTLGGVAGYPVSADGEGGRLRPDRLLCALAHPGQHDGALPARPSGDARPRSASPADPQSARPLPTRIRTALRGRAGFLSTPAHNRFGADGCCLSPASWSRFSRSFALAPYLGRNFFPPIESPQIALHVRAPTGTRIEETGRRGRQDRSGHPGDHPARVAALDCRQYRSVDQRHQHGLFQYWIDRRVGRRYPDHPERWPGGRGAGLREGDARTAAAANFPARRSPSCRPTL